ncbi:MAG TPA: response regulator [Chloroflexaceae bacterium]|nr:response regulator [Chloroflexaceae bacterium]
MYTAPPPHILVVEDDPTIAALLCDILEEHGYSCTTAGDAGEALDALDRVRPALITLDLGLPGGGGGRVLRRIRERVELVGLPVVIISAERVIPPELARASQAVLTKPFDVEQLLVTIARVRAHPDAERERVVGGVAPLRSSDGEAGHARVGAAMSD